MAISKKPATKAELEHQLQATIESHTEITNQLKAALRRINTLNLALDAMADEISRLKAPPPRSG